MAESQTNDNTCVVCFKNVVFYSIGECDHPVCYECSTRMRVLCLQNECPICRQELSRVVFTESIQPYKELRNRVFIDKLFDRQFKIGFCTEELKAAYSTLLEHRCKLCEKLPPFRNFTVLGDHVRKVHERHFCDLCVTHLKIFTNERKCYTRQELAHHRRKGDLDDTSHRGHPLCEFCEERYMDTDDLYRHLRKEHLYCHLCDADGRNYYYGSHAALAQHFRTDHFLCEEGDCAGQHLTAVFRTEIDLKGHKASVHGRGLTRTASRQARTLELQFNITPHPNARSHPARTQERQEPSNVHELSNVSLPPAPSPRIDMGSVEQFPSLSAGQPAPMLVSTPQRHYQGSESLARTDRNFPALDGNGSTAPKTVSASSVTARSAPPIAATLMRSIPKPSVSIQLHSQPASASSFRLTQPTGNRISILQQQRKAALYEDFPSLTVPEDDHPSIGAGTMQPPKVTLINSQQMQAMKTNNVSQSTKKPPLSAEAFPALSSSSTPTAPPQWITVSKPKEKAKPQKVAPAPKPATPTFHPVADFPQLAVNNVKTKNKKTPAVQQKTLSQSDFNIKINNKKDKDKKKQNDNMRMEKEFEVPPTNGNIKSKKGSRESVNFAASLNNNKVKTVTDNADVSETDTKAEQKRPKSDNFVVTSSDYPPLSAKGDTLAFGKPKMSNGAPPTFRSQPPCDRLTFTNSTGQTFSAPLHAYIPPPNFEKRNRSLVMKFSEALGGSDAVEEFKYASRAFRDSAISADEFYVHCESVLGEDLKVVFPELVALLPDIGKQQELVVGRTADLHTCVTCGQLLPEKDLASHNTAHWPPLARR